ncbi:hypothetical protein [Bacillus sp. FJAT-52991]|uniref:DUF3784 domain-containing protein n=1 Tax=Bacillus kandeliae TaxID=3129297 RepID=A0ABZ2N4J1_9BACI
MNIDMDALIIFLMIWGIPVFMVGRAYLKMSEEEKKEAMTDFKSPRFIFTIGFLIIGSFLAIVGGLLEVNIIKISGNALLIIGGIVSVLQMWKRNKLKSVLLVLLLGFVLFI